MLALKLNEKKFSGQKITFFFSGGTRNNDKKENILDFS